MNTRLFLLLTSVSALVGFTIGYTQRYRPPEVAAIEEMVLPNMSEGGREDDEKGIEPEKIEAGNLAHALHQASLYPSSLRRRYELALIVDQFASADMPGLLKILSEQPDTSGAEKLLVVELWAAKDPAAAAAYVVALESQADRGSLASGVVRGWAKQDPAAALGWVMSRPSGERFWSLETLGSAFFDPKHSDPAAYVSAVLQTIRERPGDYFLGASFFSDVFRQWARRDLAAADTFVQQLEPNDRARAQDAILRALGEADPFAAVKYLSQMPPENRSGTRDNTLLVQQLAAKDVAAALEFARAEPEGLARTRALGAVAAKLFQTDRQAALALVDSIPADEMSGLQQSFYGVWLYQEPVAALKHMAARMNAIDPTSPLGEGIWSSYKVSAYSSGSGPHGQSVADFFAAQTDVQHQEVLTGIVIEWMHREPTKAEAWAEALPAGSAREYALAGIAESRGHRSAVDSVEWLRTLNGSDYPAAVEGFAAAAFHVDPDGALAWLRTIENPSERARRLQAAWTKWAMHIPELNRATAERWRDSSPELSAEERQMLVLPKR